jgi:uncharacterized phage protein (TIGR02216 family)
MSLGLGHLQVQPDQFWRMTPRELFAAADGYMRRMGVEPEQEPLTKAEVIRMFEEHEAAQRAKQEQATE